jgi:hypothetical protein
MRTWFRVALATGSLMIAAWLAGCAATGASGTASAGPSAAPSASTSTGTVEPEPSDAPPNPSSRPSIPPIAGTGVSGTITVDGGCPVITDKGCPDRPYSGRITITRDGTGTALATALSGMDGTYRISLAPGRYVLHVENPEGKPFPRAASVVVVVPPGGYATANVRLDSGIR